MHGRRFLTEFVYFACFPTYAFCLLWGHDARRCASSFVRSRGPLAATGLCAARQKSARVSTNMMLLVQWMQ